MTAKPVQIHVATITAAHGIRGQVKLRSLTEPPLAVFDCKSLCDASGKKITLTAQGISGKGFIVAIKDVTDRNQAEALQGTQLFADASELPADPYAHLIHMEARLADGSIYGVVTGVENFGAGDLIEIEKPDEALEMLPLIPDFVEIKKDHVLIHPPEYIEGQE